jgi:hypothetical protein
LASPAGIVLVSVFVLAGGSARADKFSYRDEAGEFVEVQARVVGSSEGFGALELPDGQYVVLPSQAVKKREREEGPEPMPPEAIAEALQREYGPDRFRSSVQTPFLMGLVLSGPMPRGSEARATNLLAQVATFMKNVDSAFSRFIKDARIPAKPARFPMVVLVFESRADFEKSLTPLLAGSGMSSKQVRGFYSTLSNRLVLCLDECRTFDVALHEAIHQQAYNRNLLQRLAPIPRCFDEGIATGFEANQGRINVGPGKISLRYAEQALKEGRLSWRDMLIHDEAFAKADVLSEAYGNAWGMHWLLVTKYRSQYGEYLRRLAQKKTLAKDTPEDRLADFREAVGKEPEDLQKEFVPALQAAMKRQKVTRPAEQPPGYATRSENQGEVKLYVVRVQAQQDAVNLSRIDTHGTITNLSPLRSLTFHVVMEHSGGQNVEWLIPDLGLQRSVPLQPQSVPLQPQVNFGDTAGGASSTFRIMVESALPDSPEAKRWQSGKTAAGDAQRK